MATPPDDDAKSGESESATDVNIVPRGAPAQPPPPPPRRITRSPPPPIPSADRRRRSTQSRPALEGLNVVDVARAKLIQVSDAAHAGELAKQVDAAAGTPALAAQL